MIKNPSGTFFSMMTTLLTLLLTTSCGPASSSESSPSRVLPVAAVPTNALVAQQTTITPVGPIGTSVNSIVYDFVANACSATWSSGAGQLTCPGTDGDAKGFVLRIDSPQLETGAADTRASILTFPQNVENGYIQGLYPPFQVQNGDRFRSTISCESGATNCYVAFRLDYQTGTDPIRTLWGPFLERYEGNLYNLDVDLSSLAGKDVKFALTLLAAGAAAGDRALWVNPVIIRQASPVVTLTGTPPTATPSMTPGTATILPSACDKAQFIADVSIPDGTVLQPGAQFTKTWRLKNVGTCTWTTSYQIAFSSGEQMGGTTAFPFTNNVAPGQTIDLSASLTAPTAPGRYRGNWILKTASGSLFGIGDNATSPIWVDIMVAGGSATPTFTPGASATPTATPTPTNTVMPSYTATPTSTTPAAATITATPTPAPVNEEAVRLAEAVSPQFATTFGVQMNPSLAKGLDAARIGGPAGQLAGMIAPVTTENQRYMDRKNQVREVEGIFSINDGRLTLETMIIINKGTIQYPLLPLGVYMLACHPDRLNDCIAVSLQGQEFEIKPESVFITTIDPVSPPTVDYEEGSIRKCFRVLRRKICIRVFR